jgi:crossover junction endodeoxyribonuclease RuvC
MSEICICGVDPGLSGAIGFYFPAHPGRVAVEDMPLADGEISATLLAEMIVSFQPSLAVIERVSAMPGQGVVSMFNFGRAYGDVRGVVGALAIPVQYVTPAKWKRHFNLSADKEECRAKALHLFPACADHFKRKKDHGRAEAALIAKYGAEMLYDWNRAA